MDRVIMSRASEWVFESLKGWHLRGSGAGSLEADILECLGGTEYQDMSVRW